MVLQNMLVKPWRISLELMLKEQGVDHMYRKRGTLNNFHFFLILIGASVLTPLGYAAEDI